MFGILSLFTNLELSFCLPTPGSAASLEHKSTNITEIIVKLFVLLSAMIFSPSFYCIISSIENLFVLRINIFMLFLS